MPKRIWRKGKPLAHTITMEIPWKTRNKVTIWPSNATAGHVPWEKHNSKRHMDPNVNAALFAIARTWKQPRCPSADEWIRKLWYIYTIEYYLAFKKYIWIRSNEVDKTGAYYTEWSKPEKIHQYSILTHIYGIQKDGNDHPTCETAKETQMYRTVFWTLWERERVGWFGRRALKYV